MLNSQLSMAVVDVAAEGPQLLLAVAVVGVESGGDTEAAVSSL
jgi:hypothetical protein